MNDVIVHKPKKEMAREIFREEPPILTPLAEKTKKSIIPRIISSPGLLGIIFIIVLALLAIRSANNAKMVVNITPRSISMAVDKNLVLSKSGGAAGSIPFVTGVLDYQLSGSFPAEQSKFSEKKAEGTVVIYNKSSKDAQILVASTRLQSPDGKIFRIPSMIVIPGFTMVSGKIVPGSREVKVVADKAGPEYNIGLTDFTIPGFSGSPKFNTIFARSKTEISGGYSGSSKIVTKNALDAAIASLTGEVNKNLKNIISKELLKDQLLLPGSEEFAIVSADASPKVGEAAGTFSLKVSGKVRWVTVKKKDIAAALMSGASDQQNLASGDAQITNQDALAFKLSGYQYDAVSFGLNVKGNAQVEAYLDPIIVKNMLAQKRVTDANEILNSFPGAARAVVKFEPFWAASLPKALFNPAGRADHIDITIVSR